MSYTYTEENIHSKSGKQGLQMRKKSHDYDNERVESLLNDIPANMSRSQFLRNGRITLQTKSDRYIVIERVSMKQPEIIRIRQYEYAFTGDGARENITECGWWSMMTGQPVSKKGKHFVDASETWSKRSKADRLGGKWSSLIVRMLLTKTARFGTYMRGEGGVRPTCHMRRCEKAYRAAKRGESYHSRWHDEKYWAWLQMNED